VGFLAARVASSASHPARVELAPVRHDVHRSGSALRAHEAPTPGDRREGKVIFEPKRGEGERRRVLANRVCGRDEQTFEAVGFEASDRGRFGRRWLFHRMPLKPLAESAGGLFVAMAAGYLRHSECPPVDSGSDSKRRRFCFVQYQKRLLRAYDRIDALLREIPAAKGGDRRGPNGGRTPIGSRTDVARKAGLSRDQQRTAARIGRVPRAEFGAAVESDNPHGIELIPGRRRRLNMKPNQDLKFFKITIFLS
jgi:hypothetical protein